MQAKHPSSSAIASSFGKSTLLWLVALILFATVLAKAFQPLAYVTYRRLEPGQVAQMAIAYKQRRLEEMKQAPEVMLLGSSLMMAAVKYCDGAFDRKTEDAWDAKAKALRLNAFQGYDQASYLSGRLACLSGEPVTIFNFSCAACMASDAFLILNHAQFIGKAPKVLIYGIAPRDFADNLVPDVGTTPAFSVLADWQSLVPTIVPKMTFTDLRETFVSACWPYYKGRSNYKLLAQDLAAKIFNQPLSLAESEHNSQTPDLPRSQQALLGLPSALPANFSTAGPILTSDHLHDYQRRYNPENDGRFDQELLQFEKLLALCKDKGITCVVINMPITDINIKMIPPGLWARYNREVCLAPAKYGAHLLDLEANGNLKFSDFLDSVHTNPRGGKKILDALIAYLSQERLLDGLVCTR